MTVTVHDCRLANDPEYRKGYAWGIDHDSVFDVIPIPELIRLIATYRLYSQPFYDGLAQYCREIAQQKGAILSDPDTTQTNSHVVSSGIR
jgi:hypothetical protein